MTSISSISLYDSTDVKLAVVNSAALAYSYCISTITIGSPLLRTVLMAPCVILQNVVQRVHAIPAASFMIKILAHPTLLLAALFYPTIGKVNALASLIGNIQNSARKVFACVKTGIKRPRALIGTALHVFNLVLQYNCTRNLFGY